MAAPGSVELTIEQGEFARLLGPSGSGKTTLLRLIAGFEQPDAGRLNLAAGPSSPARCCTRGNVNTVFQDYALFPHMDRRGEYRVRAARPANPRRAQRRETAGRLLHMVRLTGLGERKPAQLSAASASASPWPRPSSTSRRCCCGMSRSARSTSSSARKCRSSCSASSARLALLSCTSRTTREEALSMSDRIAVLNQGHIEQVGPPMEVYERPRTEFVAVFIGISNLIQRAWPRDHRPAGEDPPAHRR